jgi:hypothetical protein
MAEIVVLSVIWISFQMVAQLWLCRYKWMETKKMKDLVKYAHELQDVRIGASTSRCAAGSAPDHVSGKSFQACVPSGIKPGLGLI